MSLQLQQTHLACPVSYSEIVPISVKRIRELNMLTEIANLTSERKECQPLPQEGLLLVKSGVDWLQEANELPDLKMLFGEFWHEGEVCILFADTNLGKSILAVQIADSISRGEPIGEFKLECPAEKVLYMDFEMSSRQFAARYTSKTGETYRFDSNFKRAELNPDAEMPQQYRDFDEYLLKELERTVVTSGAKVVILDNLTYLKDDHEKARDATPLMKRLKAIKERHGLSLLVLAHTPKRDQSRPLTKNDLAGSKMLMNFCDSAFALGESSRDSSMRYLKQIKARNTEIVFGAENVCLCHLEKPDSFLRFLFNGSGLECEMLQERTMESREQENQLILELKKQGLSNVEIGKRISLTEGAIRKRLDKLKETK